jgi:hypothetical protein
MAEKVIVTLTTISSRLCNVHRVIETLLSQNYNNYAIRLYLSREEYLLDMGVNNIPKSVAGLVSDKFSIVFTENIGPFRKLLPALSEFWGSDQILITVDDDVLYSQDFISTLVTANHLFKKPVAYRGRRINLTKEGIAPYSSWAKTNLVGDSILNVPTGKDGILYRPTYFHPAVLDLQMAKEVAPTTDDLWFKWHTASVGISSVLLFDSLSESFPSLESEGETLFDSFNKHANNDQVVTRLEEYALKVFGKRLFSATGKTSHANEQTGCFA